MSYVPPPGSTLPNYRTTRLLGVFNITFASVLLIFGLCTSATLVVQPMLIKAINEAQKKVEEKGEQTRKAELEDLAKRAEAAKTDKEKAEIAAEIKQVEERPKVVMPGSMDFGKLMNQPLVQGWYWFEIMTGLLVNIALWFSGIGLLRYKEWARSLGVWTALLKIARLGILYGYFIIVIVPPMSKTIGEVVGQAMVQQQAMMGAKGPGALPDAQMFTRIYTITYSIMGVGMIAIGSIYPSVMLYFMTRPRVKAACDPSKKPAMGRDEL